MAVPECPSGLPLRKLYSMGRLLDVFFNPSPNQFGICGAIGIALADELIAKRLWHADVNVCPLRKLFAIQSLIVVSWLSFIHK
jgi:hypothetical protein